MSVENYATIRDLIGDIVGKRVIDVTQQDEEYFRDHGFGFVDLMFDSGDVLRIWSMHPGEAFMDMNPSGDTPEELE